MVKKLRKKKYVIRKYIFANSVSDAMRVEKKFPADEVFIDDTWQKANEESEAKAIGFNKNMV